MLVEVLEAHGKESAAVATGGCGAIAILALDDGHRTTLGAAGACEG